MTLCLGHPLMMCHPCAIYVALTGRRRCFISSTSYCTSFHVIKHRLRCFRGRRHIGRFEHKVCSKHNHCLLNFKQQIVYPPNISLRMFGYIFVNLSTKELVKLRACLNEVRYDNLDPYAREDACIYFPPIARPICTFQL